ncbi:hypothetical protein [Streptomyces tendae]|uniref:hypothetical protein n=1 Tax=Streptomyces tendae TaxID=1932 RepID=UPI003EBDAEC8
MAEKLDAKELAAKEARVAAVEDKGYGVCWPCEVAYEKHCKRCDGPWCPACDDW